MWYRIRPVLICAALLAAGCNRTAAVPAQKSPDGTMTLTTSVNESRADPARYLCVVVHVADVAGKTLHREVTPASATQRWSIRWVTSDEVLLQSSDVGSYHIRRQPDGTWKGELGRT
jgi:hypothetical protein